MAVLEICQLRLKNGISPSDPSLLAHLTKGRSQLKEKVTDTKSVLYKCIEDPSLICVLGLWPSVESHEAFLASPEKNEIIDPGQGMLEISWVVFIPMDDISSLPLDAPVMAIARLHVKGGEHVTKYKEHGRKFRDKVVEGTKPYKIVEEWRVDSEAGKQENVIITGWEARDAHLEFTKGMIEKYPEYGSLREYCEGIEANHWINMEK